MITIKNYIAPNTIEEAYDLLIEKKNNQILGGCAFIKMGSKTIGLGIDLINLNLNYIKDEENEIIIGATTTLREVETNLMLKNYYNGILCESVSSIVGVQFRNMAQIGAGIFSKYGFSDLLPCLLVLDAKVNLYSEGIIDLKDFLKKEYKKDILKEIIIPKKDGKAVFENIRKTSGDFSILNGAMYIGKDGTAKIAIGARPTKAEIAEKASKALEENKELEEIRKLACEELNFGTNVKGTKEYRKGLCAVLITKMKERIGD